MNEANQNKVQEYIKKFKSNELFVIRSGLVGPLVADLTKEIHKNKMSHKAYENLSRLTLMVFGQTNQLLIAIEELTELSEVLNNGIKNMETVNLIDVMEEIADVHIMLNQLCCMYNLDHHVESVTVDVMKNAEINFDIVKHYNKHSNLIIKAITKDLRGKGMDKTLLAGVITITMIINSITKILGISDEQLTEIKIAKIERLIMAINSVV